MKKIVLILLVFAGLFIFGCLGGGGTPTSTPAPTVSAMPSEVASPTPYVAPSASPTDQVTAANAAAASDAANDNATLSGVNGTSTSEPTADGSQAAAASPVADSTG